MPDHFATLAQPRRPWLDADVLKKTFHRLAALHHPDAAHGGGDARFAALNTAHAILREPASRLRHLIELESPAHLAQAAQIPPALGDLFMEIATRRGALAAFLQTESAASPLARALLAPEKLALRRGLERTLADLGAAQESALAELRALDGIWDARNAGAWEKLTALQARLAFLAKWEAQLREDLFKLGG